MDPLSISASMLAILGGVKSARKGIQLLTSLSRADSTVRQLQNEIANLMVLVTDVHNICDAEDSTSNIPPSLTTSLDHAKEILIKLERFIEYKLFKPSHDGSSQINKMEWLRSQHAIVEYQNRLRDANGSISIGLSSYTA